HLDSPASTPISYLPLRSLTPRFVDRLEVLDDQHATRGARDEVRCHAAHEQLGESGASVGAHHQQIDLLLSHQLDQTQAWIPLGHARLDFDLRLSKPLGMTLDDLLAGAGRFHDKRWNVEAGLSDGSEGHGDRNLDRESHDPLGSPRPMHARHELDRFFRKPRLVYADQDLHAPRSLEGTRPA